MKKGLLLSVVASGFIFAGGNITPVQPVVPAAAPAACDFWGSVGFRYDANDENTDTTEFGDTANNRAKAYVDLGVEKALGYGFGFGAEVAGEFNTNGKFEKINPTTAKEKGVLSQLYVTYKAGNTAIKAGRQALPKAVSPWAWSDTTIGVYDNTFNAITLVNTDIADTTLVAAWVPQVAPSTKINGSDKGLFMLTGIYKGIANTTLSTSAYYIPSNGANGKAVSVWAAATTKVSGYDLGLQAVYAKADPGSFAHTTFNPTSKKATYGVAAYVGTTYNAFDAKLTVAYIKDGGAKLNLGGTSGFWGNVGYSVAGNIGGDAVESGANQTIVKLDAGYKLPSNYGKIFAGVAYDNASSTTATGSNYDSALAARIGYGFKVYGVNAKVEYRYAKIKHLTGADTKNQRIRVEGIYKF